MNKDNALPQSAQRGVLQRGLLRCALILGALLAGCQSGPKNALPDPEPELRQIASQGYVPQRRHATTTLRETWTVKGAELDVSWLAPSDSSGGPYPLIVYLPGLGESSSAGLLWRKTWAEAGYAVLAIQPMDLTENLWRSPLARAGDFQRLAQQQFAPAAAAQRARQLHFVLDELKQRHDGGGAYATADLSRIVVAGFDLGARTALVASGEKTAGATAVTSSLPASGWTLRAVIVLSPFFDGDRSGAQARYAALSMPVLSITGTLDDDPYSLVRSAELRQVPWNSMPPGSKYSLVMTGGSHALLSGTGFYDPGGPQEKSEDPEASGRRRNREDSGNTRRRRIGPLPADPGGGGAARGARDDEADEQRRIPRRAAPRREPEAFRLTQIAAVQGVSAAFLDVAVKADSGAKTWLAQEAARWLGAGAVLHTK